MEFTLNPKRVAAGMLTIIGLLAMMHIGQLVVYYRVGDPDVFDFIALVDFDIEGNLPALYSSCALFFCAALLWSIGWDKRNAAAPFRWHWLGLAVIFTFLGIDEGVALHEEIGDLTEELGWVEATGYLYFAWVVPYGILLLLFAGSYLRFVFALPRPTALTFVLAGSLFILGAVGIEVVSANEAELHGSDTVFYSVLYTIEELFEMVAIVIFSYGLLRYIETERGAIRLRIDSKAD